MQCYIFVYLLEFEINRKSFISSTVRFMNKEFYETKYWRVKFVFFFLLQKKTWSSFGNHQKLFYILDGTILTIIYQPPKLLMLHFICILLAEQSVYVCVCVCVQWIPLTLSLSLLKSEKKSFCWNLAKNVKSLSGKLVSYKILGRKKSFCCQENGGNSI